MYRSSWLKLTVGRAAIPCAVTAMVLAGGCAREVLSVDFASQQSIDLATDRQTLLIVGAGFNETSEIVLEISGIRPLHLQTKLNTTGMLEATLSRADLSKDLQAGVRYSASVCVQNAGAKACSDKPLLVTVAPDGSKHTVGTSTSPATVSTSSGGSGPTDTSNARDNTSPTLEGDRQSPTTSATVTSGPDPSPVTPTPGPGDPPTATPTPVLPTTTPTSIPTPTRTPVPGKDVIFLLEGTLNGQEINAADPAVLARPGAAIRGTVRIAVHNTRGHEAIFPLGATYSWGNPETSYWQVSSSVPPAAVTEYTVQIDVVAPSSPGDYFIIIAGTAEHSLAHVMSSTSWEAGIPRWNDGDDVADWDAPAIQSAIRNGYVAAACYLAVRCEFAASAIIVRIGD